MAKARFSSRALQNILTGVAGLVTALTGLYVAYRSGVDSPVPSPALPMANQTAGFSGREPSRELSTGNVYVRTPWLGVELYQRDQPIEMRSRDDDWCEFEATLDDGSFEFRITRAADDPSIGILAWHDDSIFELVQDEKFMLPGTGIAGGRFAVPLLYLDKHGFNYYNAERMKHLGDNRYSIFVSTIASGDFELPLSRFAGPIYLVIFRTPDDFEMEVPRRSYEFLTLHR